MNPTYDGNTTKNIIVRSEASFIPLNVYSLPTPLRTNFSFGFAVFVKYGALTDWNYGFKRISTVSMYRIERGYVRIPYLSDGVVIDLLMNRDVEYKASGI